MPAAYHRPIFLLQPNIYRLMQMNPTAGNSSIAYNHLFQENRASNRLELIADFTDSVDVEIIASLKVLILASAPSAARAPAVSW